MSLKVKERRRARFHAVQALYQREVAKTSIAELKVQFYKDNVDRHAVEWDFFYRLLDGVDTHNEQIDTQIGEYAVNNLDSINPIDLSVLRLGSYELLDCLDIPYQVILNEYVDQVKALGSEDGHRFINGLLERLAKEYRVNEFKSKCAK